MTLNELTLTRGDVTAASEVLTATAAALIVRGEELWPLESLTPTRLLRHYPAPDWRVAWAAGRPVGAYVLLDKDPLFWPDAPPGEALYLHKLAVHPDVQGQGVSGWLLRQAVQETAGRERPFLRLDTASARPRLRAVYERFGFRHVGERVVRAWPVSLYQYLVT